MTMVMYDSSSREEEEEEEVLSNIASKSVQQQPREKRNGGDDDNRRQTARTRRRFDPPIRLEGGVAWLGLYVRGGLGTSENAMGKERRKGKHAAVAKGEGRRG